MLNDRWTPAGWRARRDSVHAGRGGGRRRLGTGGRTRTRRPLREVDHGEGRGRGGGGSDQGIGTVGPGPSLLPDLGGHVPHPRHVGHRLVEVVPQGVPLPQCHTPTTPPQCRQAPIRRWRCRCRRECPHPTIATIATSSTAAASTIRRTFGGAAGGRAGRAGVVDGREVAVPGRAKARCTAVPPLPSPQPHLRYAQIPQRRAPNPMPADTRGATGSRGCAARRTGRPPSAEPPRRPAPSGSARPAHPPPAAATTRATPTGRVGRVAPSRGAAPRASCIGPK
jgi:hypothetical protein